MAAFAQFASDLDKATQQQLARGERMVELLKQGQYLPQPVEEQVLIIYAGTHGYVDEYPTPSIGRYERELMSWMRSERTGVLEAIVSKKKLDETLEGEINDALRAFAKTFEAVQA